MDVEPIRLGRASIAALDGYVLGDRIVYADEKRELGKQLLHFFGYKSIPEFHSKTIGIGIRREKMDTGELFTFGIGDSGDEPQPCPSDPEGLGKCILEKIVNNRRYRIVKPKK